MARRVTIGISMIAIALHLLAGSASADSIVLCEEPEPGRTLVGELTRFVGEGAEGGATSQIVVETELGGPWVVDIVGRIDLLKRGERYQMTTYSVMTTARRVDRAYLHFDGCGPTTSIWRISADAIVEEIPLPLEPTDDGPFRISAATSLAVALISAAAGALMAVVIGRRRRRGARGASAKE
jgi:hypothetical protein